MKLIGPEPKAERDYNRDKFISDSIPDVNFNAAYEFVALHLKSDSEPKKG
ncbi:MAG: hypothetical protein HOJ18_03645 [Rhodospirillaceae bacterium]|jgi:hypothetical protein|nr:hypothetical protein [Rhodospirillaceae bacterium]